MKKRTNHLYDPSTPYSREETALVAVWLKEKGQYGVFNPVVQGQYEENRRYWHPAAFNQQCFLSQLPNGTKPVWKHVNGQKVSTGVYRLPA